MKWSALGLLGYCMMIALSGCGTKKSLVNQVDIELNYLDHITLDCSDADWNECSDTYSFFEDKFGYSDSSDFRAEVKMGWNERSIALFANVNDDILQTTNKKADDRMEIFISSEDGSQNVVQYIFSGFNDSSEFKIKKYSFITNKLQKHASDIKTAILKRKNGFCLEALIPLDSTGFSVSDSDKFFVNVVFIDADGTKSHSYPLFINDNTYNNVNALQKVQLVKEHRTAAAIVLPRIWTVDKDSVYIQLISGDSKDDIQIKSNQRIIATRNQEDSGINSFCKLSFKRSELNGAPSFDLILNGKSKTYYFRDIDNLRVNTIKKHNYDDDIDLFEEYDKLSFPPQGSVLFIGSSSIRLWRTLKTDFPEISCINRGFGGSCTADAVYYFDRIVKPYNPRKIVLYTGSNDLNKGMKPEEVVAEYKRFIELTQKELPQSHLIILSVKISVTTKKRQKDIEKTNALLKKLIAQYPGVEFVDVIPLMTDKTGAPLAELFCGDSTHMNTVGYNKLTEFLRPYIIK